MRIVLMFLLFSSHLLALAQFEDNYTPLRFQGELPEKLLKSVQDQTQAEIASGADDLNEEEGREFYTFSNFALKQTLRSGNVHFHDEVTEYLNRIVDYLLRDEPELRQSINVYTTKLLIPNATCWRDGTIFVNLSLLPHLESEAQLAFILSHEISHYQLKHSLNQFRKRQELGAESIWEQQDSEKLFELLRYGKDQELEADIAGLERILQSDYDPKEALSALMQLKFIDQPQANLSLDLEKLFQLESLPIKPETPYDSARVKKLLIAKNQSPYYEIDNEVEDPLREIEKQVEEESDEEELSTHPSIENRIDRLSERLAKESNNTSSNHRFIFGEESFDRVRKIAIFERVEKLSRRANYSQSLYLALRLAEVLPDNQYLHEKAAKSLFWMAHFSKNDNLESILPQRLSYGETPFTILLCTLDRMDTQEHIALTEAFIQDRLIRFSTSEVLLILKARTLELKEQSNEATKAYRMYTQTYPVGRHARFAKRRIQELSQ